MIHSSKDTDALSAFRHHRHDVMNSLQMIRAYTQLGRMEQAIETVDRLADWLKSLSLWQNSTELEESTLVWHAATCPQVKLTSIPSKIRLTPVMGEELMDIWTHLNTAAQELGIRGFEVQLNESGADPLDSPLLKLSVKPELPAPENWKTLLTDRLPKDWPKMFEICLQG